MDASTTDKRMISRCGSFCLLCMKSARTGPRCVFWASSLFSFVFWGWALAATLELPPLTAPGHDGWTEKRFSAHTVYEPVQEDGAIMLRARSQGAASGLFHERSIDLVRTPWLNWTWKVGNILQGVNELEKSGDDYPARVYVVAKGGVAFWKTKALSYVWSSGQPRGAHWSSAFTANAHMIAVRSGTDQLGMLWVEKRNIREDWKMAFGEDITRLDAVAIMTDTDNSGQSATAWYGTPWFSEE